MNKFAFALALTAGFFVVGSAHAQKYSFVTINDGLAPTTIRRPYSINDSGTILLQSYSAFNTPSSALFIKNGSIQTLDQAFPYNGYLSVSNAGSIIGSGITGQAYYVDSSLNQVVIQGPAADTLYPGGINSSGLVVGMATSTTSGIYAWTWKSGTFSKYIYPGSSECTLNAVNDVGDTVGTYFKDKSHSSYYAFAVIGGKAKEISVSGCIDPTPTAISGSGIIAGTAITSTSHRRIGFVRLKNGSVTTIDYSKYAPSSITGPNGTAKLTNWYETDVFGVNSSGIIVGTFTATYETANQSWAETQSIPFIGTPK